MRFLGFLALGGLLAGCYTLKPALDPVPEVGTEVAFDVNDAGRVALGGLMGPEIARVGGRLVQRDTESFLLAVTSVELLRGGHQVWTGEQVRLQTAHLGTAYERRFSLTRSLVLGAIGFGGFGAFLVTRSLFASGNEEENEIPPPGESRLARP